MKIPIEISARHIHLSKNDVENLFGKNHNLKKTKDISQPNQFACKETVSLINGDKIIENVRIVGPERTNTQVEISKTDAFTLKVNPPVRISGDIKNSSPITLKSRQKTITIKEGLIIAKRHLHIAPSEAEKLNIKNGDKVSVRIDGERSLVYNEIIVRSHEGIDELSMHLDTDEANAGLINPNDEGELVKWIKEY